MGHRYLECLAASALLAAPPVRLVVYEEKNQRVPKFSMHGKVDGIS